MFCIVFIVTSDIVEGEPVVGIQPSVDLTNHDYERTHLILFGSDFIVLYELRVHENGILLVIHLYCFISIFYLNGYILYWKVQGSCARKGIGKNIPRRGSN